MADISAFKRLAAAYKQNANMNTLSDHLTPHPSVFYILLQLVYFGDVDAKC